MAVILVVDDEQNQRNILKTILSAEGYETYAASSGEEALKAVKTFNPDVVLTDMKMDGMSGIDLMENILSSAEHPPAVVVMTAFGTIHTAVEAMKKGAYDYLEKPLDKDKVLVGVRKALENVELRRKNVELQQALYGKFSIEGIVGTSALMKEVIDVARKVANSPVTVLILGESGTGKELFARAIHYNSPRSSGHFTAINCAAIPESLIESELFGYEPGAFTGATTRKIGLFEATNGGTMFLDEVGDLPAMTQSKILRVLQEKEIRRIGGREAIKVDVRIIAATNKDLEKEMTGGKFREDLYYRLRVIAIELPPLRDRREDIPELVRFFIQRHNAELGKRIRGIDETAMKALIDYHWPGNVRQLESVIERALLMCESDTIRLRDIKSELRLSQQHGLLDIDLPDEGVVFEDIEKELLKKAMSKADNVAAKAARLLGMSYKTFWYRWEKFGLEGSSPKREDTP
jgi:DNA-binding NtrC family response regulator